MDKEYMLPDEYEQLQNEKKKEEEQARKLFRANHPDTLFWLTGDLEQEFKIINFSWGIEAQVIRKADGKKGSVTFTNAYGPRIYYDFIEDK